MNFKLTFLAAMLFGAILAGGAATARAQSATAPGQLKKADPVVTARELANYRSAVASAHDLALADKIGPAELALTAANHSKPNTAQWHIETAQRLIQLADQMARENRPAVVSGLIASALQHLTTADSLTTNPTVKANAKTLTGFIQERYLGDADSALASYQAAALLAPNDKRAAEAADRVKRTSDELRGKLSGK